MVRFWSVVLVVILALAAVACGGDDDEPEVDDTPTGPLTVETARTCDQVMDLYIGSFQGMLDTVAELTMEEVASGEWAEEFEEDDGTDAKWAELNCGGDDQFNQQFRDRLPELTADGPVAEIVLQAWITEFGE